MSDTADKDFFKRLPKVELHAHINGSIAPSLLKELVETHDEKHPNFSRLKDEEALLQKLTSEESDLMTLDECFQAFKSIHRVSGNAEAVIL